MTDTYRYRFGDTDPKTCAVDSGTVIEIGDLVYLDVDDVKPATSQSDQGTEAANQELFADNFMGVAMQRSRSGDTAAIRVATKGTFEFVCPSGTWELGDLVGVDEAASGTALLDQQVASVANGFRAIGRVARRQASAVTTVLVDILSTKMHGGVMGTSGSGL
jgi:hypothetical protein